MKHRHTHNNNPGQLFGVVAVAAGVGAVVALLFTPRTGQQLRRALRRRAGKVANEAEGLVERGGAEASVTTENAKQRLQDVAGEVVKATKTVTAKHPKKPE